MPNSTFSLPDALKMGQFILSAYDLFTENDPADFSPPDGYSLVSKIYADDITDGIPDYKVFGFIAFRTRRYRGRSRNRGHPRMDPGCVVLPNPISLFRCRANGAWLHLLLLNVPHRTQQCKPSRRRGACDLVAQGTVQTLRITGHSLGSALATLLALDVAGNKVFATPSVYTFASPRVGDKVFAGTYDSLVQDSWRINNLNDLVPQLPPLLAGYVHVDAEVPINSDDRTKHTFRCWHALLTYLNTLDSRIALDAECVPTS